MIHSRLHIHLRKLWETLFPEVRPYTGPDSLKCRADQQVFLFNGRVVIRSARCGENFNRAPRRALPGDET